jgi:hypothetical protein
MADALTKNLGKKIYKVNVNLDEKTLVSGFDKKRGRGDKITRGQSDREEVNPDLGGHGLNTCHTGITWLKLYCCVER